MGGYQASLSRSAERGFLTAPKNVEKLAKGRFADQLDCGSPSSKQSTWTQKPMASFGNTWAYRHLLKKRERQEAARATLEAALATERRAEELRERAERGDRTAQFEFGLDQLNRKADEHRALEWFRRAADAGDLNAACELAKCLGNTKRGRLRAGEAVHYARLAAEGGIGRACAVLGHAYEVGDDVQRDFASALEWYRRGVELGDSESGCLLGYCYQFGRGVPADLGRAEGCFETSAEAGHADALCALGVMYSDRADREADTDEAVRLRRKSVSFSESAANAGSVVAQYNLALDYLYGHGVAQDAAAAFRWFRSAAEGGDADAQYELAIALRTGRGIERSEYDAVPWLRRAADQNHALALRELAVAWENGEGVATKPVKAVECFQKAAKLGDSYSQCELSFRLAEGVGCERNDDHALVWLRHAEVQDNQTASALIGVFYLEGRAGLTKDVAEGLRRLHSAASHESPWAQQALGQIYLDGIHIPVDAELGRALLRKATLGGRSSAAIGFGTRSSATWSDVRLAQSWLREAARQGSAVAKFWQNRLYFVRYRRMYIGFGRVTAAAGYAGLIYHLVTRPFEFHWIAVALFVALVVGVGSVALAIFFRGAGADTVEAEFVQASQAPRSNRLRDLWAVPAEDGIFLLPLLYVGASPLNAAIAGCAFALVHYPTYPTKAILPKGVAYFLVGVFLLPRFGIWSIIVGHVFIDVLLVAYGKFSDYLNRTAPD